MQRFPTLCCPRKGIKCNQGTSKQINIYQVIIYEISIMEIYYAEIKSILMQIDYRIIGELSVWHDFLNKVEKDNKGL